MYSALVNNRAIYLHRNTKACERIIRVRGGVCHELGLARSQDQDQGAVPLCGPATRLQREHDNAVRALVRATTVSSLVPHMHEVGVTY